MITIRNLHKEFGSQTLLRNASLQINDGERFALAGPNGSGKSTLFRMLMGEEEADKGEIHIRKGAKVGYLRQTTGYAGEGTVLEEVLDGQHSLDGRLEAKAKSILMGLGFKESGFDKKVKELSGGWGMRAAIARILLKEPDLLLLDEPTNHLDLDSLLWFQEYLQQYPGAIFLITHDRAFLNAVCHAVVSVLDHDLKVYWGTYEDFLEAREKEKEKIESAYHQQQKQIAEMEDFIARNLARLSTAGRAQSMKKRLEKLELIQLPREMKTVKIKFPQPQRAGHRILELKNIHKSYGPVKVYEGLDFTLERGQRMAFVGHNGAGKSTLLKILAGVEPIDSGERVLGTNAKVGYFSQYRNEMLNPNRTVFMEAADNTQIGQTETFIRTVLGTFLFPGDTVFKKVGVLSGGEKSRLALVKLLLDPPNVLLMDEPTTHLDMPSVDALIEALKEFEGTLCFISHDIYFINQLATHIAHVENGRVALYPGNYEYFTHRQDQIKAEELENAPLQAPVQVYQKRDSKTERRERALERERSRQKEKNEKELAELKEKIEILAKQYEDPAVYGEPEKLKSVGDELRRLQERQEQISKTLDS